jgi:diguanylate cyclase (GGDEF)-like protein
MGLRADFLRALESELNTTNASGTDVTLLLLDVDDFAAVTARVGPLRAGQLLRELERRLTQAARPDDTICRTGGDGLGAILPAAGRLEGESVFARLQARLRDEPLSDRPVGVSAGIATARPGERPVELLARAANALREAKQAGKGTAKAAG